MEKLLKYSKDLIIIVLLVVILIQSTCNGNKVNTKTFVNNLYDTIQVDDNKFKTSVFESNKQLLLAIKTQDSTIKRLQSVVKEHRKVLKETNTVTVFDTKVEFDTIVKTVVKDSIIEVKYVDDWIDLSTEISDSAKIDLVVTNKYDVVIGDEGGLFKSKPFVQITNLNPYSKVTDMKTYRVKVKQKRFGIGIQLGFGVGSDMKFSPYLGIGVNYNIIKF